MTKFSNFFGENSPLKTVLPGFRPREGQGEMAVDICDAIDRKKNLIIEAGTGIGKTFAYLAPALMSGKKIIISTGTKTLQDQLYKRDLPLIAKVLGRPVSTSLLKGRSNYLCLHRLDNATSNDKAISQDLKIIHEWKFQTDTGDLTEINGISETSNVWSMVTCTNDNCPSPSYDQCYFFKARKLAQKTDLSVINHHLLFADLAMKEEGFSDFLPEAEVIIIDEAHQIPDIATQFFGKSIGTIEIERFIKELLLKAIVLNEAKTIKSIDNLSKKLKKFVISSPKKEGRYEFHEIELQLNKSITDLCLAMREVAKSLANISGKDESLGVMLEILEKYHFRLNSIIDPFLEDGLRWIEVTSRSIRLNITPLDIGNRLRHQFDTSHQAWIFTSATIAIDNDFTHFKDRIGLINTLESNYPSPYTTDKNALVYLPKDLPDSSNREFTREMLKNTSKLIDLIEGGVFFLFTSNKSLYEAKKWFSKNKKIIKKRMLLSQGDSSREELLRKFREDGKGILLGTKSFWEGVDVRGAALKMVIIDKLPFKSPADPLMMARLEHIKQQGGNGFIEHQLPTAVLSLKQGVGRLLRDQDDYGLIVICDNRIQNKGYGAVFKKSLAPMKFTGDSNKINQFLESHQANNSNSKQ